MTKNEVSLSKISEPIEYDIESDKSSSSSNSTSTSKKPSAS